jgi:tagatose-6-phosphate ketose/aldose isomerase
MQQPDLWEKIYQLVTAHHKSITSFLKQALAEVDEIILTGAGTSAFIGMSLQSVFFRETGILARQIPTTDILSHPQTYLVPQRSILMVSFARSGNSPESCATVELADAISRKCFHLIITCNAEGDLAHYQTKNEKYLLVLPPESNDESLAMTSSYTGMLLTGLLIALLDAPGDYADQIKILADTARRFLKESWPVSASIAEKDFNRAVFLGSGVLAGAAQEGALKLQELTDGKIICKADTYLGFRHGPKAVIDEHTLIMYLFSSDAYAFQYELDLLNGMNKGNRALYQVGLFPRSFRHKDLDVCLGLPNGKEILLQEDFSPLLSILPCQLVGLFKSMQLGLMPDSPSASGAISRVVEGVKIYPMKLNHL